LHIADSDDLYNYVRNIPPLAMRLVNKYWPGPVTIILRGNDGNPIGIRWPNHPVAQDLLRLCNFPVIVPSLNPREKKPAVNAQQAKEYFDGKIEMILDGGPTPLNCSSTVVRVDNKDFEILREGPVTRKHFDELTYTSILFICSGNTCRSPMAEGLCKKHLAEKLNAKTEELLERGYLISSAGTTAYFGTQASKESILAMKEMDVDITGHKPSPVNLTKIDMADWIFTMTRSHLQTLLHWNPFIEDRAKLLREDDENISDPFGGTLEEYKRCAESIENEIKRMIKEFL